MSVFEHATIVTPSASNAFSIASTAQAQRHTCETLADRATRTRSLLHDIGQVVGLWLRRRNDRAMLRAMSLREIHDFCPRQADAEAEMNKPFWRA